jgi:capsid protein
MFNPRRVTQSRGKPALTSAIDFVDKVTGYVDAELVAAKVNACFSMFVSTEANMMPEPYTGGVSTTGEDDDGNQLEKMEPGSILYGRPGESATGIGQTRPGTLFDPFVRRMLTFIGRPICMPLMLITLDFAGATFMNARIAYQKVQEAWEREQDWVIKPFCSRAWRWKVAGLIAGGRIKTSNPNVLGHEVMCKRWPYVDPLKEAQADNEQLQNRTINRTLICARQGLEYDEVEEKRVEEDAALPSGGLGPGDEDRKIDDENRKTEGDANEDE